MIQNFPEFEKMDAIFQFVCVGIGIGFIALRFWTKLTLERNGYEVNWFGNRWDPWRDIRNMWKLEKETANPTLKKRYFLMALGMQIEPFIIIVAFLIFVLLFVFSPSFMQPDPCEYATNFKQTEWNGIVIKKYRDTLTYNVQTIEAKNESRIKKIQNWRLFQNGNFELIAIGDSISKQKGENVVRLYKNGKERILEVDYECEIKK